MTYLKTVAHEFLHSFTQLKKFLVIILYDLIFFAAVCLSFYLAASFLSNAALGLEGFESMPAKESTLQTLQLFMAKSLFAAIAFFIVYSLLYAFFRVRIWHVLLNFHITKKLYLKFGLISFVWSICWALIFFFFMKGIQPNYAAVALALLPFLYVHFTTLLHYFFFTKHAGSIVDALSFGVGKIHLFIFPYILAVIVLVAWSQFFRLLPTASDMFFALVLLNTVIFIPYFAWFRIFIAGLMKRFG